VTPSAGKDGAERILIRTKLKPPALSGRQVERPRLLDRLDQGSERRVTLISAPAGYGKTTLAVQWRARNPGGGTSQRATMRLRFLRHR
jgi:LuxR family maltose regulon positive regulatory protein